jgi:hypothetical protein
MFRNITITLAILVVSAYGNAVPMENNHQGSIKVVSYNELFTIMQKAKGYNPVVTTNACRFQTETLLRLLTWANICYPENRSLLIRYKDWFMAYLATNNLNKEDAPTFMQLAYKNHQDIKIDLIDHNNIKTQPRDRRPLSAADITIWWPKTKGAPRSFSFIDMHSVPKLKVVNKRVITYRLLDFGDMVVCDKIKGLEGRPISGLLGLMFRVIGVGRVVETRMAISEDGLQITRAHTKKGLLNIKATVTVYPDGRAVKGVLPDRLDLDEIATRLSKRLKIT